MKALVTGATGFIGSVLIEELNTLGFDVLALMRKTSSTSNLEGLKYERVEGDISDESSLRRAVRNVDYVFHLAGLTATPRREAFFECNTAGTERLARVVAEDRPGLNRFVYVSSLAAAGPAQGPKPKDEAEIDHPVSAYGESKLRAERALLKYKSVYPISIIRPPWVYGPKDRATLVLVQTLSRNLMPVFRGSTSDGHKYYSSIHVKDLCRGIVQAGLVSPEKVPSGEIFFLCADGVTTLEGMLSTIAENLDRHPLRIKLPPSVLKVAAAGMSVVSRLTRRPFPLTMDKLNEILPDYWICSNSKAKQMLGFSPEFEVSTGIPDAIEWYRRQKWI